MKRFCLHPGIVVSKTDGDHHFIGAYKLLQLYGVNPTQSVIYDEGSRTCNNRICLFPRYDGNYEIPERNSL